MTTPDTKDPIPRLRAALPMVDERETVWCSVQGHDLRAVLALVESQAAELARVRAGAVQVVRAKSLSWSHTYVDQWIDDDFGFSITHEPEEEKQYHAAWGEDDAEEFSTLEEAQAWCQSEMDAWVKRYVVLATHTEQPAPPSAAAAQPVTNDMLECDIAPRPLAYPLRAFHRAGIDGPLHYTWADKPHRLLYDLIAAVRFYATPPAAPEPTTTDAEVEKAWARLCLENCRLFAARHRKEEWAKTILRFCAEGGATGSPLRTAPAAPEPLSEAQIAQALQAASERAGFKTIEPGQPSEFMVAVCRELERAILAGAQEKKEPHNHDR